MSMERAKYMGHRAETERKMKELKVRAQGLVDILRDKLDPILPVGSLDSEGIPVHAFELHEVIEQYREQEARLESIKGILGE